MAVEGSDEVGHNTSCRLRVDAPATSFCISLLSRGKHFASTLPLTAIQTTRAEFYGAQFLRKNIPAGVVKTTNTGIYPTA
jgi:hypothetical protein